MDQDIPAIMSRSKILPGRFYSGLIIRLALFIINSLLFAFSVYNIGSEYLVVTINLATLLVIQLYLFYRFFSSIDREISRLFTAIKNNEFSDITSAEKGDTGFGQFLKLMEEVNQLSRIRAREIFEKELLLEEIIEMSPGGIILFDERGAVSVINRSAMRLLGVRSMSNINELDNIGSGLKDRVINMGCGRAEKLEIRKVPGSLLDRDYTLLAEKEKFTSSAGSITILAIQDIRNAVISQEIESWQKIIRVIRHEIMNSLSPIPAITSSLRDQIASRQEEAIPGQTGEGELLARIMYGLNTIDDSSRSILGFISRYRQLLTIPMPVKKEYDLLITISECVGLFREELNRMNIVISIRGEEKRLICSYDHELVKLSLINILKNGMEALTATSSPAITIYLRSIKGYAEIKVSDNGPGIPEEIIENIFVPFFTTRSNGSGIGLSLARQIAIMHGGELELVETGNGGTTFRMILPSDILPSNIS